MRKLFGRKQSIHQPNSPTAPPTSPLPPEQPRSMPSQRPPASQNQQLSRALPPLPPPTPQGIRPDRQDSASSYQSSAINAPTTRSSFQQQQHPSSGATAYVSISSMDESTPPSAVSDWIVVENSPPPTLPVVQKNGNGSHDNLVLIRPQHSFESRSSSLASLPPGAGSPYSSQQVQPSPASPYTTTSDVVTSPLQPSPLIAPPTSAPPSAQSHKVTNSRRLVHRKLSDPSSKQSVPPNPNVNGYASYRSAAHAQSSADDLNNNFNTNTTTMSHAPTEKYSIYNTSTPQPIPVKERSEKKNRFLDWLGGDKERQARERTSITRAFSPDPNSQANSNIKHFQEWDSTKIIGYVTATASEDWAIMMELCDRASSESGARECAKALRSELRYAEAPAMLSAARLWAIMLRNSDTPFINQTSSKKFLEAVEETYCSPMTSPVVKERLEVVVGGAAAQFGDRNPGFRTLWKRIRQEGTPINGMPFDPKDPMLSPPARKLPKTAPEPQMQQQQLQPQQYPQPAQSVVQPYIISESTPIPSQDYGTKKSVQKQAKRSSRMNILSQEEDMRRLFEECEVAKHNASLLSQSLTYAKPEDVISGSQGAIIREFHAKCRRSDEILSSQVDWATVQADRARATYLSMYPLDPSSPPEQKLYTIEEELLKEILQAHQELLEAFRMFDELERLAVSEMEEREVQERSRKEVKLDRTKIQYYSEDGSFMTQPVGGAAGSGPSRSPSPSREREPALNSTKRAHPLPVPPQGVNGSSTLAPPPQAPYGPRQPMPRSRSPSPEPAARRSFDGQRSSAVAVAAGYTALKRGMSKLGVESLSRSSSLTGRGRKTPVVDDYGNTDEGAPKPSAKALGKRKAEPPEEVPFDTDDLFKDRALTPLEDTLNFSDSDSANEENHGIVYAYDASAEREKEWVKEARQHRLGTTPIPST